MEQQSRALAEGAMQHRSYWCGTDGVESLAISLGLFFDGNRPGLDPKQSRQATWWLPRPGDRAEKATLGLAGGGSVQPAAKEEAWQGAVTCFGLWAWRGKRRPSAGRPGRLAGSEAWRESSAGWARPNRSEDLTEGAGPGRLAGQARLGAEGRPATCPSDRRRLARFCGVLRPGSAQMRFFLFLLCSCMHKHLPIIK